MNFKRFTVVAIALLALIFMGYQPAFAQSTIASGSISGAVTDAQGAAVTTAKITITNKDTGLKLNVSVSSSGSYDSGPLASGVYSVRAEATGFKTTDLGITVQVGVTSTGNIRLEVGQTSTVIEVTGSAVAINTEQATVQGVVTQDQIENLPVNGRNFLDLAQLEPGVQIQDGGNFDPTKNGFSSISFGGRFGRTARIELDGIDISDETVGTTTQNVPISAIKEFQISQSTLDLSSELTSSGSVNISTQSGTNGFHGGGFYQWRSNDTSSPIGNPAAVFDRKQYGADLGGPIIKNKLFFFGAWERTIQANQEPIDLSNSPFASSSGAIGAPFLDNELFGKLDYQVTSNIHLFYRFGYEHNDDVAAFVPNTFSPFGNVDYTPSHVVGLDFTTGSFTHQIRFGYMKFRNAIANAIDASTFDPAPGLELVVGNGATSCTRAGNLFCSGPNILAPQETFQQNTQVKYDGSKLIRSHLLRYGVGFNHIQGGGFASFFGIAPAVRSRFNGGNDAVAAAGPFPGGDTNPLNWPVNVIELGNGQGCFTESPAFGFPCGGQHDNRFQWYIGDSWKVRSNLTFNFGLRYVRDTGRSDSDLPALDSLNAFQPGLGNPPNDPGHNFAPQLGVAWDPWKTGKTVFRAGAGIFYENAVFNNVLFDRPGRLPAGLFNLVSVLCPAGNLALPDGTTISSINGHDIATQVCTQPMGSAQDDIVALQQLLQTTTAAVGAQANGGFFGNILTSSAAASGTTLFAPSYRTPFAYQMNVGVQHEIKPGTVISVDYLRNIGLHYLLAIDENRVGDSRYLNVAAAQAAISATNATFGCGTGFNQASIDCSISRGALIGDFAGNGLTSGTLFTGGLPSALVGAPTTAFPGRDANFGQIQLLEPTGRSVYNALQVELRSNWRNPVTGVKNLNMQVAYSLSRYTSEAQDIDFINTPADNRNPGASMGPNGLDRTHQLSAGVVADLPWGARVNFITHWYTALPQNIFFADPGNAEDLFQYDLTGDGTTTAKPVPGSRLGSFGRDVKANDINKFITNYSDTFGNQITPAGQALVSAGLFSQGQLEALCAVTPSLNPINNCANRAGADSLQLGLAPSGQVGNDAFFTFDLRLGWSIKPIPHFESFRVEPQVGIYNLFNRQNYNGPLSTLNPTLDGAAGSINGTTSSNRSGDLIGLGTGTFALGSPRAIEFGVKVNW